MNNNYKIGFIIYRPKSRTIGFVHLNLELVKYGDKNYSDNSILKFSWQADSSKPADKEWYWYGGEVEPGKSIRTHDDIKDFSANVRRFLPKDKDLFWFQPADLLDSLKRKRIRRVVYDPRLSNYVELDDVPDPKLDRWLATGRDGNCIVDCLAYDEQDAKKKLRQSFVDYMNTSWSPNGVEKKMAEWLEDDCPMRNTRLSGWPTNPPTWEPVEDLIRLGEKEETDEARVE